MYALLTRLGGFSIYKNTYKMNKKQQQIEQLTAFAQLLKDNGFTVLIDANHPFNWVYFEKGGLFGDVQPDGFSLFNFGSAHIPSRSHGTGLSTEQHTELTIENAIDAINRRGWGHIPAIKHYQNVEHFIKLKNKDGFSNFYIL